MDKYKRYYGVGLFVLALIFSGFVGNLMLKPQIIKFNEATAQLEQAEQTLATKQEQQRNVEKTLKQLRETAATSKKKIYTPDTNLDGEGLNDTLFYTLYKDLIDMLRSNSIKVKTMDYKYNPEDDEFVKNDPSHFLVTEVDMELVSNYINLGKFIEAIYQYHYYIRIMKIEVEPYPVDKKILVTHCILRLYARTAPAANELELIE